MFGSIGFVDLLIWVVTSFHVSKWSSRAWLSSKKNAFIPFQTLLSQIIKSEENESNWTISKNNSTPQPCLPNKVKKDQVESKEMCEL